LAKKIQKNEIKEFKKEQKGFFDIEQDVWGIELDSKKKTPK
jgi:hypothetical protein